MRARLGKGDVQGGRRYFPEPASTVARGIDSSNISGGFYWFLQGVANLKGADYGKSTDTKI